MKSRSFNNSFVRKVITIALCSISATAVMAQRATDDVPMYDSTHAQQVIEFKALYGIGFNSILQNYGSQVNGLSDMQLSPGVLLRAGMDVRFALRNSFAICTGMAFDINNSKYALSVIDGNTGSISSLYVKNHFYEVTIPLYMSFRLNLGRRMRWNIDFGAYFATGAGGKTKSSGYTSGLNSLGQPVITQIKHKTNYFEAEESIINGVKKFDYGPRIATGYTYRQRYSLNAVFELSLPNLAINHNVLDCHYRNIALLFEFGYNF